MKHEENINQAITFWRAGKSKKALLILLPLLSRNSADPVLHGLMASIYFQQGKYRLAFRHFDSASRSSPKSELAIRGMVHSALKLGWRLRAIEATKKLVAMTRRKDDIQLLQAISGG